MAVEIRCPTCQRGLRIKEKLIGKSVACPACQARFVAGAAEGLPTEASHESIGKAPVASDDSAALGRIGRFKITAALGQGGFGKVYKAHDPILDRDVAIKVPKCGQKGAERLILEARAAAPLRHPNIVAVFEAGADGDNLYIAAEYVEGQTLAERAGAQPVAPALASEWVKSLAEALDYAHGEKVIHRDVKPQNVMIGAANRAQLMDFGLAISQDAARDAAIESLDRELSSDVAGTPAYMSPEQARGEGVGPASDQFGLGVVFFELLTGKKPTHGADTIAQVAKGRRPRAVRALRPEIPRDLEAVCLKAMAPDPQDRYVNCRAMAEDIGRWQNDELVRARRHSPWELAAYAARKRPALFAWGAAAACLLALLLGSGAAYGVHLATNSAPAVEAATAPLTQVSIDPHALSRDVVREGAAGGDAKAEMIRYGRQLDRTRMAFRERDVVLADRHLEETRWDYRNWEYNYLRRIVTGGWKTIRGHRGEVTAIAMHPEAKRFASAASDGAIRLWDGATGKLLRESDQPLPITSLAFSPDGKTLAAGEGLDPATSSVPATPRATPDYAVALLDGETLERKAEYREHKAPISCVAFSPDGRLVASGAVPMAPPAGSAPVAPGDTPEPPPVAVRVWNAATQRTELELDGAAWFVGGITFSNDGAKVIASTGDGYWGQMLVWNLVKLDAAPRRDDAEGMPLLAPESRLPEAYGALAAMPGETPRIVAAPGTSTRLLEMGRRRVAGDFGKIHLWSPPVAPMMAEPAPTGAATVSGSSGEPQPAEKLENAPANVLSLAVSPEPTRFGSHTIAVAGGDPLARKRPGSIVLFDPNYEYGGRVNHLGHRAAVTAVAFRHDGKQFISGDAEGVLKIWSAEVHPEVVTLEPDRSATRVAFGKDGRFVAVAERSQSWTEARGAVSMYDASGRPIKPDGTPRGGVKLYDIRSAKETQRFEGGPGDVLGLAFDPEMTWLAAGGDDAIARLWNLDGDLLFELKAPGVIRCLAASADGKLLAAACSAGESTEGMAVVWSVADGKQVAAWPAHAGGALAVAFSHDGKRLATSGADRQVRLWSARDWKETRTLVYEGEIVDLAFRPHGDDLAGAGHDPCRPDQPGQAIVWGVSTGEVKHKLASLSGHVHGVVYSPDGKRLVAAKGAWQGSLDQPSEVCVYDAETGIELLPLVGRPGRASKEEATYETYSVTQTILVTEAVPQEVTRTIEEKDAEGNTVTKEIAETIMVNVCRPETQMVTRTRMRKIGVSWEVPGAVLGIAFSGDGRSIAAACEDGAALVWDAETCQPHDSIEWHSGALLAYAVSPDGKLIATAGDAEDFCSETGLVRIYDAVSGRLTKEIESSAGPIHQIAFLKDGERLAIVAGGARVGDKPSREPLPREDIVALASSRSAAELPLVGEIWSIASGERTAEHSLSSDASSPLEELASEASVSLATAARARSIAVEDSNRLIVARAGVVVSADCESCPAPRKRTIVLVGAQPHRVRISRDGKLAATAVSAPRPVAPNHPVRRIDAAGKERKIGAHRDTVRSVAVSPDGSLIASVAQDQQLQVVSPEGESILQAPHPNKLMKVAFSGDGKKLATATAFDGQVYLWSIEKKAEVRRFQAEPTTAFALAFDREGKHLLTGGLSGAVKVWSVETGELVREWQAHPSTIHSIVFDSTGERLVSCSDDKTTKLWRFENGELLRTFEGFAGATRDAAFAAEDRVLAVGAMDPLVRIFDVRTGEMRRSLDGHGQGVWSLAFSPDNEKLACCGRESPLVVWNWRKDAKIGSHAEAGECLAWRGNDEIIAGSVFDPAALTPKFDGVVALFDAATGAPEGEVVIPDAAQIEFDVSVDGRYVAAGTNAGKLLLWDRSETKFAVDKSGHEGAVRGLAFHPSGEWIATAGQDGYVRFWSLSGEEAGSLKTGAPVACLAFAPNGEALATGDGARKARMWRIGASTSDGWPKEISPETTPTIELAGHYGELCGLSFSGDGARLATTSRAYYNERWVGDLKVWDVATGKRLLSLPSHTWWDAEVAFHPTEPYIATTGRDHTVQMFHAESGRLLFSEPTNGYLCSSLAFEPSGERLLAIVGGQAKLIDATPEEGVDKGAKSAAMRKPPRQNAADREAAEWVLARGGQLQVLVDGVAPLDVNRAEELPADPYRVSRVALAGKPEIGDADLAILTSLAELASVRLDLPSLTDESAQWLGGLPMLREVFLNGAQITDEGLRSLGALSQLRILHLNDTRVAGPGLAHLRACEQLANIELHRTALDDEGLAHLLELPNLTSLGIAGAKVTDEAVEAAKAKKPQLQIHR